jgi:2-methylcitrate dehydratase PrpD
MEIPLTQRLVTFCITLDYDNLPAAVVHRAKYFFLDYLGVAVRGSLSDSSQPLYRIAQTLAPEGSGTVLGRTQKTTLPYAALSNGTAAHSLELDDTHQGGSIHLGVSVFSAASAMAESMGASGKEFLTASVAGFEVAARLAMALKPADHYARGFHPTATCGTFGAAASAARLLHLNERQFLSALGIAGSQSAGSMEFLTAGAWTKRFHPGWAAFSGLHAALLAKEGFFGPTTILEGQGGFLKAYAVNPDPSKITQGLGDDFQILQTAVKPYACCRYTQAPIDAVLKVVHENDIQPQQVEQVTIGMLETGIPVICEPADRKSLPTNVVEAQFSLPFGVAVALAKRRAGLDEFTETMLHDAEIGALMAKVDYERDPALEHNYPQEWPAWAKVKLQDGREVFAQVRFPTGDPENPLSWDELTDKYRDLVKSVWDAPQAERVFHAAKQLESERDMHNFTQSL